MAYDIFISWANDSGGIGKSIAGTCKSFIEEIFKDRVKVFVSNVDITHAWNEELEQALKDSHYLIVILTPQAVDSLWMSYEYGVLRRNPDKVYVYGFGDVDKKNTPFTINQVLSFSEDRLTEMLVSVLQYKTDIKGRMHLDISLNITNQVSDFCNAVDGIASKIEKGYKRNYELRKGYNDEILQLKSQIAVLQQNQGTNAEAQEQIAALTKDLESKEQSIANLEHDISVEQNKNNDLTKEVSRLNALLSETKSPSQENLNFNVFGVPFKMILVKGGSFQMGATDGDDDEKPVHTVTLSDYYIAETEVTQGLWKAVMGENPSSKDRGIGDNYPVNMVSWNDAQDFIKKLNAKTGRNFCLPTEAQWEFAARGGNRSQGYKYSGSDTIDDVAWYYDNSKSQMHPVKRKKANELGIYDMSGNVLEWCQDWYKKDYYQKNPSTNPQGPSSGSSRVLRGGSWLNSAGSCRVSFRIIGSPDGRGNYCGVRLALPCSTFPS